MQNDSLIAARARGNPRLAIVVESPSEDAPVLVQRERVIIARRDGSDALGKPELARNQAVQAVALDDAAAELVLFARAPGVDVAGGGEGQDVVGARGERGYLFEGVEGGGVALDQGASGETEDAVVALGFWLVVVKEGGCRRRGFTRKVPQP